MRNLLSIFLLGLISTLSLAEDHAVIVDDSKPGTFLLTVGQNGSVSVRPLEVTRVGTPSRPTDPVTPSSSIQNLTKLALADGGTKTTAAGIATVYSLVSSNVGDGSISLADWPKVIREGTNRIITSQPDGTKWTTFRAEVSKSFTELANKGELSTKEDVADALKFVADEMNKVSGFEGNLTEIARMDPKKAGILDGGIDLAKIIEMIKMIMELLKLFKS